MSFSINYKILASDKKNSIDANECIDRIVLIKKIVLIQTNV